MAKLRFSLQFMLLGTTVLAVLFWLATRFADNEYVTYGLVSFVMAAVILWQAITYRPQDPDA